MKKRIAWREGRGEIIKFHRQYKSVAFPCGTQWEPVFLAYDPAKLVGLSSNAKGLSLFKKKFQQN